MDTHCRERGFGLIEILVAVAIGLILVGGIIQVFMSTRLGYQMDSGLARLQENARAAIDFTSYDVRMAGFMGCPNLDNLTPNNILDPVQYPGLTFNPADAIAGHEYTGSTWAPALPAALSGLSSPPLADTDVVRIQMGTSCGAYLTGNMTADNANIQITEPNDCGFAAADPLLITDCANADLFAATNVSASGAIETIAHANNFNITNRLSKAYGPDAEVMKFESLSYYVANGAGGTPSLWRFYLDRAAGGNNPEELVEGVENLQVLYGEDTTGDRYADTYVAGNAVGDWQNVVSVRLGLLVDSVDNASLALDTATYNLIGTMVDPTDDRLLRKAFRETVSIRNRHP